MTATPIEPSATDSGLVDSFGRRAEDLRISLTDKCSLRCTYCMPAEGLPWLAKQAVLDDDEIVRLAGIFIELGVSSIRLTGGEPLVRPGVAALVARLAEFRPRPELSLTTNAIALADQAEALTRAGLDRVNVSLDTLDAGVFHRLTRRDRLDDVLAGLAAAQASGLYPVKINAVLMREVNLQEGGALLGWALRGGYELRFIEHMPLDAQHAWSRADMVTADEILQVLQADYVLRPIGRRHNAPAEQFEVLDGPGRDQWAGPSPQVGIIASVTRPFCRDCDRLRLTADGQLRTCLFAHVETDLRALLRDGASDVEIAGAVRGAVAAKPSGHGITLPGFRQPERPMSAIGG
ncbi:GTP 3',8-cyclase MoaA [Jatrophihabitans telluris]|uniref:GTP 3',8-cyclase n=1 Tax=Jatrophihabitans telluris TaxID=2038343 RepID=A0ABY4R320_9ACTN|nr:GTP 3',8-cyclase MoaA [Jatrophihabitans telluris]UQX90209.1 GTP 3',8-cyclase MoaA [Jatrophihabitans telluris]